MGKVYKFFESELQHSGANAKPKFMYIDVLPEQEGELTYNGEEQFPAWKNLDPLKLLVEGEKSAIEAGKHYITVTPMGNFAWPDNTQTPKEIEYTIKRKKLSALPSQKNVLTYNNNQQTPTWNNYNSTELTIGGVYRNQTGAGSYKATFTPTKNYCWSDESFGAKEVSWTIGKLKLAKPSASTTSYSYTGSEVSLVVSNYNSSYMTQGGTVSATEIGSYSATYTLNSTTDTTWSDGSTGVVTITWSIASIKIPRPTANTQTFTFNFSSQEPTWTNYNSNYMTKSLGAQYAAGEYTTTFSLKPGYTWSDGTTSDYDVSWKINKKTVKMPYITGATTLGGVYCYEYDGEECPRWGNTDDSDFYEISGAETEPCTNKTVTVSLIDKTNTQWTNNTTNDYSFTLTIWKKNVTKPSINKTSYTYDGNTHEPTWSNFNEDYMTKSGDGAQTGAGDYSTTVSLKDPSHYKWNGETSSDPITESWTIEKKKIKKPTSSNLELTYNGRAQEPSWSNYNSTYMSKEGGTAYTDVKWSGGAISGTTTQFWLEDQYNTCWEDGTSGGVFLDWKIVPATLNVPTFKSAIIFTDSGHTVTASDFSNVSGCFLKTSKTYTSPTTDTVTFESDDNNHAWKVGSNYVTEYDVTITVTDTRFPFTFTDTDGNSRTVNSRSDMDSIMAVTNTTTDNLVTRITLPSGWSAADGGGQNISTGGVTKDSGTTYIVTSRCRTRPAHYDVSLTSNTGAAMTVKAHIYS